MTDAEKELSTKTLKVPGPLPPPSMVSQQLGAHHEAPTHCCAELDAAAPLPSVCVDICGCWFGWSLEETKPVMSWLCASESCVWRSCWMRCASAEEVAKMSTVRRSPESVSIKIWEDCRSNAEAKSDRKFCSNLALRLSVLPVAPGWRLSGTCR